jgi:hypothetical protein
LALVPILLILGESTKAQENTIPYLGLPEKGKTIALQLVSAAQSW